MGTGFKRILAIAAINGAVLGLGLFVIELCFGGWVRSNDIKRLNLVRSRVIKYDVSELYDAPYTTVTYTRDRYGLRGAFDDPSEIDILTVGGSTTDQRFIQDGLTWQDVLQREFEAAEKNVVVCNGGVDGQSSYGHIKNFDWWFPHVPGLKPRHILFYVGVNDFYKDEGSEFDALLFKRNDKSFRQMLRDKSALYHVARTIRGVYIARFKHKIAHGRDDFSELEWTTDPVQTSYDFIDGHLDAYTHRLHVLIAKTREFGSEPIFVTQPSRQYRYRDGELEGTATLEHYGDRPINGVDYFHMMRRQDRMTTSVCAEYGVRVLDLAGEMVLEWEDEDFYDVTHMTPSGAEKVGVYLFERLRDLF